MFSIAAPRTRCAVALVAVASSITFAATAGAVHWPFYGGDAGRSGNQPVQEAAPPFAFVYRKGDADDPADKPIVNSIVTSTPAGTGSRFAYGTEAATVDVVDGRVHVQLLDTGAPVGSEAGVLVDNGAEDLDTFTGPYIGATTFRGLSSAGVAFADSSTAATLGQLYVVHNDDNQDGTNDIGISVIDEATGVSAQGGDFTVPGTNGFSISSSPVLTADASGNRTLFFVAHRPFDGGLPGVPTDDVPEEGRLYRVPITNAQTTNATLGTPSFVVVPGLNPVASPTLVNLSATGGTVGYVAVSTNSANTVRTYRQDTLAAGPMSGDLGDDGQTPSVPVAATGLPADLSPALIVAVGQTPTDGDENQATRVYRLVLTAGELTTAATSPDLAGTPAPALALDEEAGGPPRAVVVTTSANLYVLESGTLAGRARLYFSDNPPAGGTFRRTTAAVSGGFAFVTTDSGGQLVLDIENAQPVPTSAFTQNVGNNTATVAYGQPSISRRFVQFGSDQGAFVYRGTAGTFVIDDAQVVEGDSGTRNLVFTVRRTGSTADQQSVTATTSDGTATVADNDYEATTATLVFAVGDTEESFSVPVNGDGKVEADETLTATLTNPTGGAEIGDTTATGTIIDDDSPTPPTTLSIGDVSITEGDSGQTQAMFTITKSGPGATSVTVNTADGSATAGSDYVAVVNQTVTFTEAETTKTVTVLVNGDTTDESDEQFLVRLSAPTNGATVSDSEATGTIIDNDATTQPTTVSVSDAAIGEGDAGNRALTFTVSLSRPADGAVTVDFATENGSAVAGSDYVARSGTVTFAAGEQSKAVTIDVAGDTLDEDDETFTVRLSNAAGTTIGDATGTGTIADDDKALLSVSDATVVEGDSGTKNAIFAITLSIPTTRTVTVAAGTVNQTATAGSDYTATSATVSFAPGETVKAFLVPVHGDTRAEDAERFLVGLVNAGGAAILDGQAIGTIADDDGKIEPVRVLPRITASTTPSRDRTRPYRFTTSGRIIPPSGLSRAEACATGRVSIQFKVVRKTVSTRRPNITDDCRFRSRVTFDERARLGRGILRVQVRFLGNRLLKPRRATTRAVRAG